MPSPQNRNTIYWRRAQKQGKGNRSLIWLRNRIIRALNETWTHLDCFVVTGDHFFGMGQKKKLIGHHLFIMGVANDGRAIVLYPIRQENKSSGKVSLATQKFMLEYEKRGAIVGTCADISDAYDVVIDDEREYPRKKRTFVYRKTWELNGQTEEE